MPGRRLSAISATVIQYAVEHPHATQASVAEALRLNFNTVHTVCTRHKERIKTARQQNEEPHDSV